MKKKRINQMLLTAVTLDLMPCQKERVSYWFWVVSVFHTRIMLSPTPSARHPVPTGEKVRAYTNPPRVGSVQQQSSEARSQHLIWGLKINLRITSHHVSDPSDGDGRTSLSMEVLMRSSRSPCRRTELMLKTIRLWL